MLEALAVGGGGRVLTVELVYAATAASGTAWSREMVAKTIRRMTVPARRPPFVQLERAGVNHYRYAEPV